MAQVRGSKKRTQEVPEEIKEYYQAGKRDRMWVVWLLSGATFIVTVLVVLGLFWGGRWAFDKMRGNDTQTADTSQSSDVQNQAERDESVEGGSSEDINNTDNTGTTPAQTPAASTPTTTPNTGSASAELPRTGPSSDE